MSPVPWPTASFRVRSVLACTLGAALLASSKSGEPSRIAFENRQERSGVTFVLNNGTTDGQHSWFRQKQPGIFQSALPQQS